MRLHALCEVAGRTSNLDVRRPVRAAACERHNVVKVAATIHRCSAISAQVALTISDARDVGFRANPFGPEQSGLRIGMQSFYVVVARPTAPVGVTSARHTRARPKRTPANDDFATAVAAADPLRPRRGRDEDVQNKQLADATSRHVNAATLAAGKVGPLRARGARCSQLALHQNGISQSAAPTPAESGNSSRLDVHGKARRGLPVNHM